MSTPKLGLAVLTESQEDKELTVNQNSYLLDALINGVKAVQSSPPGSPAAGDAYVVSATATGAWAGRENQVAYWFNGGWSFLTPQQGLALFVLGSEEIIFFNGGWTAYQPVAVEVDPLFTASAAAGIGAGDISNWDDAFSWGDHRIPPVTTRTTSNTLVLSDNYRVILQQSTNPNTVTIPTNASVALPVGSLIEIWQVGAGATTIAAAGGVTLNGVTAGSGTITARYGAVTLRKIATNSWLVAGAIGSVA